MIPYFYFETEAGREIFQHTGKPITVPLHDIETGCMVQSSATPEIRPSMLFLNGRQQERWFQFLTGKGQNRTIKVFLPLLKRGN